MTASRSSPQSALPLALRQTWPVILIVLLQAALAGGSIYVMSAVRAIVAGESQWSKGQKDAVYHLDYYAESGNPQAYRAFLDALAIPLGDRAARLAMERPVPDLEATRAGFLQGRNHPDDIAGMIWLLRTFREWDIVRKPTQQWLVGDRYLLELQALAQDIHARTQQGEPDAATRAAWLRRIGQINNAVTPATRLFSERLGESSRFIVTMLLWANGGTALLLILITLAHHRKLLAQRQHVEAELSSYVGQLSWQASHDALTGLVNRREFEHQLGELLSHPCMAAREGALLYCDLDQFKLVNDTCGHQAGDEMLRQVCRMLQSHLREGDTLARLGGDEFGILLRDCPAAAATHIAERLRQSAQDLRFTWGERQLGTGLSVGLVPLTPELGTVQEALRVADMACYRAKEGGRNKVFTYQRTDTEMSRREGDMDWVRRLRLALEQDRFCLYSQEIAPLQATVDGGLHVELLLRLRDEDGRLVPPGSFIPAAERYGMMPAIDRWVVQHALTLLKPWARTGYQHISTCAINLSGASLGEEGLLDFVRAQLAEHRVDPQRLCFEITETSAIAHLPSAVHLITELRLLGCRFSLDDFGAGMSSFNYLKHLPVDYLKIDGSFVKDLTEDATNRVMVEVIHHIGQVMGKRTIAEFAESPATVEALRAIGVDYAQGYAVARPVPFEEYLAQLSG